MSFVGKSVRCSVYHESGMHSFWTAARIRVGFYSVALVCGVWLACWPGFPIFARLVRSGPNGAAVAACGAAVAIAGMWGLGRARTGRFDHRTAGMVLPAALVVPASVWLILIDPNFLSASMLFASVGLAAVSVIAAGLIIAKAWHSFPGVAAMLPLLLVAASALQRGASTEIGCITHTFRWQVADRGAQTGQPARVIEIEAIDAESLPYPRFPMLRGHPIPSGGGARAGSFASDPHLLERASLQLRAVWLELEPDSLRDARNTLPEETSVEFRIRRQNAGGERTNFHVAIVRFGPYPVSRSEEAGGTGRRSPDEGFADSILRTPLKRCSDVALEGWQRWDR